MEKFRNNIILLLVLSMAVIMTACGDLDDPTIPPKPEKPAEEVVEYGTVEIDWQIPDSVFRNMKTDQFLDIEGFSISSHSMSGCTHYDIGMAKHYTLETGVYNAYFGMIKYSRTLYMHNLVARYNSFSKEFRVVANDTVTITFPELRCAIWRIPSWYEP